MNEQTLSMAVGEAAKADREGAGERSSAAHRTAGRFMAGGVTRRTHGGCLRQVRAAAACAAERATKPSSGAATASQSGSGPQRVHERCRNMHRPLRQPPPPARAAERVRAAEAPTSRPAVELAFYRRYTEAMLRRYLRLSMQTGRVPSLLGRDLFRGNVTSYRVRGFEDAVVFCIDVERCLARLDERDQALVRRVALERHTQGEAAALLGLSLRTVVTGYAAALDRVTSMFLDRRMLEGLGSCQ